jgi:hypothetical protein
MERLWLFVGGLPVGVIRTDRNEFTMNSDEVQNFAPLL